MPKLFSFEAREEFFDLVAGGCSLTVAATVTGVSFATGVRWWREVDLMELRILKGPYGGLEGTAPPGSPEQPLPQRQRRCLTSEERAVIAAGRHAGWSYARIATAIGRDKSVVWREVRRNRSPDGVYHGGVAHRAAHERRRRPKEFKLAANPGLCRRIEGWMDQGWSPGLIAQMLKRDHPHNIMDRVSHETIYETLYVQTRGQLRADLSRQLSLKRRQRKPRGSQERRGSRYREAYTIRDRPAEAADRAVPGHWEGDLIMGPGNKSAIGTLVERSTRFTILLHLPDRHDAEAVADAMIREMRHLPDHLRRSITWDRGSELADYTRIQLELATPVYFCDPHSPWQRGTNENTNRLLRFWFEKGSDLSGHTAQDLRRVADTLNQRPRPTLDLQTPADTLNQLLKSQAVA